MRARVERPRSASQPGPAYVTTDANSTTRSRQTRSYGPATLLGANPQPLKRSPRVRGERTGHRGCPATKRRTACSRIPHRYSLATVRLRPGDRVCHDPCRRRAAEASRGGCQLRGIAEALALTTVPSVGNPLRRLAVIVTSPLSPGRTPITSRAQARPDSPPPHGRGGRPHGAQAAARTRRAEAAAEQPQAPLACRHAHASYARLWTAIAAASAARRRGASPSRASTIAAADSS
jgi:hypothetical protein